LLQFKASKPFTLGIELEIQIVSRENNDLSGLADDILQHLKHASYDQQIKPEITQSMLEINSGIHDNVQSLATELHSIRDHLLAQTESLNLFFAGGGTHPFQMWNERKLYPKKHYIQTEKKYGYLTKMFTVFGMHIHIGCANPEDALYLTHALARHIPQFIALSASSPFCQGVDTEFCSSRSNMANLFPLSGMPPFILNWQEFCKYFDKMQKLPWVENINNFYWDIRPRPEYGTVEIRVCDMPLTIEKAVAIAAFAQSLAKYLVEEKPYQLADDKYDLYRYNRFQASKSGFDAALIEPETFKEYRLIDDLFETCRKVELYSKKLDNEAYMLKLIEDIANKHNDAAWLRKLFNEGESLKDIVYLAGHLWAGKIKANYS
jgi:carboxylate-amine ligase